MHEREKNAEGSKSSDGFWWCVINEFTCGHLLGCATEVALPPSHIAPSLTRCHRACHVICLLSWHHYIYSLSQRLKEGWVMWRKTAIDCRIWILLMGPIWIIQHKSKTMRRMNVHINKNVLLEKSCKLNDHLNKKWSSKVLSAFSNSITTNI